MRAIAPLGRVIRGRAWIAVVAAALSGACHRQPTQAAAQPMARGATAGSTADVTAPAPAQAGVAKAATDVCTLITPDAVSASFGSRAALGTSRMGEAHGPACGYPHPDHGGYLLVIQLRTLASWDTADTTGAPVGDLGVPARLDSDAGRRSATLFVRDEARDAVVMFLAPDGPPDAVLRVASRVYRR